MKRNYAQEFKELAEQEGYRFVGEYINTQTNILLQCSKGHEWSVRPNNFKNGNRCPKCAGVCPEQAKDELYELAEKEGYKVIGKYKGSAAKILLECPDGHEWNVTPGDFKSHGNRCPKCAGKCSEQAKDELYKLAEKEGYKVIGKYKSALTKILLECPVGHKWESTPTNFKNHGNRCPKCAGTCSEQAKDELFRLVIDCGYKVIGKYKSALTKILLECPVGHKWETVPSRFKHGGRCGVCWEDERTSKGEGEVREYVKEQGFKVINNIKNIPNPTNTNYPYEMDIWLPEQRKYIDYRGEYWHGEDKPETRRRDEYKDTWCKENGIDQLIIWNDDWNDNQEEIKQRINDFLEINP